MDQYVKNTLLSDTGNKLLSRIILSC